MDYDHSLFYVAVTEHHISIVQLISWKAEKSDTKAPASAEGLHADAL